MLFGKKSTILLFALILILLGIINVFAECEISICGPCSYPAGSEIDPETGCEILMCQPNPCPDPGSLPPGWYCSGNWYTTSDGCCSQLNCNGTICEPALGVKCNSGSYPVETVDVNGCTIYACELCPSVAFPPGYCTEQMVVEVDINTGCETPVCPGTWCVQGDPPACLPGQESFIKYDVNGCSDIVCLAPEPVYAEYAPADETTDLTTVANPEAVLDLTLKKTTGKIKWNVPVNTTYQDFDTHVEIGSKFISVDSRNLNNDLNSSATLTFNDVNCNKFNIYYSSSFATDFGSIADESTIIGSQANIGGNCISASDCTAISCSSGNLTFTVPHFSGYAVGTNSELDTWDENEGGTYSCDTAITFYANYSNITTGEIVSGADCNVRFDDDPGTWFDMTENANDFSYTKAAGFSVTGLHVWNVSCTHPNYEPLNATDTVNIDCAVPPPGVPEFNFLGLIMIVIVSGIGMYFISKQ